jgi:hypothetical protein
VTSTILDNPGLADVALPGFFILQHMGIFQTNAYTEMFDSILGLFGSLVGSECSLVQLAETGSSSDCKLLLGERLARDSRLDGKVKSEEALCGAYKDEDNIDLYAKFPNIILEDDEMSENYLTEQEGDDVQEDIVYSDYGSE